MKDARIILRSRDLSGGTIPSNALSGEAFVNIYEGVVKFSGSTQLFSDFEPSDVSTVFEVGSKLYNSKITNRLNINDNFVVSGLTGIISTYEGVSGAGLSGKFLSGTTDGFVLEDIQNINDITRIQPGTNISTGGTANFPNINTVDSPFFNQLTTSGLTSVNSNLNVTGLSTTGTLQVGQPGDSGTTTTIYGDLIVVGDSISGFTSELYIEDNLIELNYNPTADTTSTSLGAGFAIQDGSGVAGTDVFFDIRGASTGVDNRGFATNLNDIYIRESGTTGSPGGVRVIAEQDVIDGGVF